MPRQKTKEELEDRIDELEAENETLQDQVDSIADIIEGEDEDEEGEDQILIDRFRNDLWSEGIRAILPRLRLGRKADPIILGCGNLWGAESGRGKRKRWVSGIQWR